MKSDGKIFEKSNERAESGKIGKHTLGMKTKFIFLNERRKRFDAR